MRNKRGTAVGEVILVTMLVWGAIVGLTTRANYTDQLDKPKFKKEKTIDQGVTGNGGYVNVVK